MVGGKIEFSFTDNPDWRTNVTQINGNSNKGAGFLIPGGRLVRNTPGLLSNDILFGYNSAGVWTITLKATGYQDATITVTVQ